MKRYLVFVFILVLVTYSGIAQNWEKYDVPTIEESYSSLEQAPDGSLLFCNSGAIISDDNGETWNNDFVIKDIDEDFNEVVNEYFGKHSSKQAMVGPNGEVVLRMASGMYVSLDTCKSWQHRRLYSYTS